ncbi:MAG: permease, partial [Pseudomonadota bacterium]
MSDQTIAQRQSNKRTLVWGGCLLLLIGVGLGWPEHAANAAKFVFWGLVAVAPIVFPGILLAAWIIASGADTRIASAFEGR